MISGSSPEAIRAALGRVGASATTPARIVLIGGCNLAIRGVKSSTKDVDLVITDTQRPEDLLPAFAAAGFETVDGYYLPGAPLDPHTMLEDAGGMWIDLFLPHRLFGDLDYSPEMAAREHIWFRSGALTFCLADPSSVFLLKSVTGRWRSDPSRDLPDLVALVDAGLVEWDFVHAEWTRQRARHHDDREMVERAREAVANLRAAGFRRLPWRP